MKLVVLLGLVCVGLAVEVSAMSALTGAYAQGLNPLASILSQIQRAFVYFIQGLFSFAPSSGGTTNSFNSKNGGRQTFEGATFNTGPTTNSFNSGKPVPNGGTSKYGYVNVMTHIPTISEDYGRIVKLEKKKNEINVILLRENGKISSYKHANPIDDVNVQNKPEGVTVTITRNGKKQEFFYY
ncbi:hypothetical protein WDU94_013470 [Cyamophila willieti]